MVQKKSNSNQLKNSNGKKNEKPKNAYFLSLELENVRCFSERQNISFSDDNNNPKTWTIILGDNGTGKTTILQCIVAMLPDKENTPMCFRMPEFPINTRSNVLINWNPFRHKKEEDLGDLNKSSELNVRFSIQQRFFQNLGKINKKNSNDWDFCGVKYSNTFSERFWDEAEPLCSEINVNCFGYGASRKAGETSLSEQNEESPYSTLFKETALLLNPEEWLLQTDYAAKRRSMFENTRKQQLELVKNILVSILPDVDEIRFSEKYISGRTPIPIVEFHTPYGWIESKDLSLGYRTSMAWIVDFASRMFDLYPESENPLAEPAVVLIDEIDLHLHPKWQRELLDYLSNLFPNTQFIVTTHSPLIVQSAVARDANIVVCRREGDHVVIDQSVEAVRNWRADQILTSDFFGLETARPKEIEPLLEEREKILSKAKLTKKDEKRLTELENEIGVMPVSENPEDDKAMDIIRRAAERLESQK